MSMGMSEAKTLLFEVFILSDIFPELFSTRNIDKDENQNNEK